MPPNAFNALAREAVIGGAPTLASKASSGKGFKYSWSAVRFRFPRSAHVSQISQSVKMPAPSEGNQIFEIPHCQPRVHCLQTHWLLHWCQIAINFLRKECIGPLGLNLLHSEFVAAPWRASVLRIRLTWASWVNPSILVICILIAAVQPHISQRHAFQLIQKMM